MRKFANPNTLANYFERLHPPANAKLRVIASAAAQATTQEIKSLFGDEDYLAPLQPATIEHKTRMDYDQPEAPLIATGQMRDSVTEVVKGRGGQIFAASGTEDPIAIYHEFGVPQHNLPPRPVFALGGIMVKPKIKLISHIGAESIATGKPTLIQLEGVLKVIVNKSAR